MTRYQPRSLAPLPMTAKLTPHALRCILAEHEQHLTEPPHAGTLESMSPSHTLRPVIDELRESAAETASRYSLAYDPAVDAAARGMLSASCLSGAQLEALQARLASEHQPIADFAPWDDPLPIGMIEPRIDATAALASLAEAESASRDLAATIPRRPTLLRRLMPTSATAFWMAVSVWLGFLLARAEGWL